MRMLIQNVLINITNIIITRRVNLQKEKNWNILIAPIKMRKWEKDQRQSMHLYL